VEQTRNTWGSSDEILKAIAIIDDGSAANLSAQMGQEHKVRNFYNNIIAPNSPFGDATMDTHAVAAAHLLPMGSSALEVAHNFGAKGIGGSKVDGVSGNYWIYLEAYRRAAASRGLQPRQMQSIVWEAIRLVYSDTQRRDKKLIGREKENVAGVVRAMPAGPSSQKESLLQLGLDPAVVDALERGQAGYEAAGMQMSLVDVAQFEGVELPPGALVAM